MLCLFLFYETPVFISHKPNCFAVSAGSVTVIWVCHELEVCLSLFNPFQFGVKDTHTYNKHTQHTQLQQTHTHTHAHRRSTPTTTSSACSSALVETHRSACRCVYVCELMQVCLCVCVFVFVRVCKRCKQQFCICERAMHFLSSHSLPHAQTETNTKIAIRGRGSVKEGIHREGKYDYGEDEELHVLITGNTQQDVSVSLACCCVCMCV